MKVEKKGKKFSLGFREISCVREMCRTEASGARVSDQNAWPIAVCRGKIAPSVCDAGMVNDRQSWRVVRSRGANSGYK